MVRRFTALPDVMAISVSCVNTKETMRGFGLKSVRWLFFEFYNVRNLPFVRMDPWTLRTEQRRFNALWPRAQDHQLLLDQL
jgi:hypothetical protein